VAADHGVSEHVELLEGPCRLEDGAEAGFRAAMGRPLCDIAALDDDATCVDTQQAGDACEQR